MKNRWFAHDVDRMGFPTDPELRRMENELARLAVLWRGNAKDPEKANQIVHIYQDLLLHLYELGWDTELHFESQLPDDVMPEEWFRRNPQYRE